MNVKQIILATVLSFLGYASYSQTVLSSTTTITIKCYPKEYILAEHAGRLNEYPLLVLQNNKEDDNQAPLVLAVNQQYLIWSLLFNKNEKETCILLEGTDVEFFNNQTK